MYSIQTTPGFIIDSKPYGEAGKALSIFTRDLGLVRAMAQGIRLEKSKLRYHALDCCFGEFSFVRGKDYWRLTSAEAEETRNRKQETGESQELLARIALLLRRLLHGEESHPELFDSLKDFEHFLNAQRELKGEQLKTLESLIVLRILHHLGYVANDPKLGPCLGSLEISTELLKVCGPIRTLMNQNINKALKESQL